MDSGNRFDWIPFYKEVANKLLDFKDNRKQLVDDVYSIYKTPGVTVPHQVEEKTIIDIDPFTFYGLFNRGPNSDSRQKIVQAIAKPEILDISTAAPTSFDGIPTVQQSPLYFKINSDGYETDIDILWNLFEAAIKYSNDKTTSNKASISQYFELALNISGDQKGKITIGLYWIAPDVFLSLDQINHRYIYESGKIPAGVVKSLPDAENKDKISPDEYFEIIDKISNYLQSEDSDLNTFYELSYEAYNDRPEEKGSKSLTNAEEGTLNEEQVNINEKSMNDNTFRAIGGSNILYYGVPGAGKSYTIDEKIGNDKSKIERVVFHPDYTYSDFVGQILPRRIKEDGEDKGKLDYPFVPGPFTRVLEKAIHDPGNKYYLVIEEINRGNAPAIFGDIFQLLDRDENGDGKYAITNYDIADYVYKDGEQKVNIPSNLTLYATMNTSDQNVFTLDTAFQRRWDMQLIHNNINQAEHANQQIEGSEITWGVFATTINKEILSENKNMISSEDKRLGAYFITKDELNKKQFAEKVLKYLWDDAFKMSREDIFDESLLSLEDIISIYESAKGDPLKAVLKPDIYSKMSKETNEPDTQEGNSEPNQG